MVMPHQSVQILSLQAVALHAAQPLATRVMGAVGAIAILLVTPLPGLETKAAEARAITANKQSQPSTDRDRADSVGRPVGNVRFACQFVNGEYTVMYYPQSQPDQAFPWAVPSQLGGGWTPERRCAEISRRLEFYRPDGLQELQTSTQNGYDIICVTTEDNPACRIVLTVPPGQDPMETRDRVFENLTVADSGERTEGVAAYTGNDGRDLLNRIGDALNLNSAGSRQPATGSINLRPFLDPADGGTGAGLTRSVPVQRNSGQLNPGNFR